MSKKTDITSANEDIPINGKRKTTPTRQMIAIFKEMFLQHREGHPKVDFGKDGALCKRLWAECRSNNPENPLDFWRQQCEKLIKERDISSIGGISAFWNTAIPKKKDKVVLWKDRKEQ